MFPLNSSAKDFVNYRLIEATSETSIDAVGLLDYLESVSVEA